MRMFTVALLAMGCVSKGKFTELQSQFDAYKAESASQLQAETGRATSLDEALRAEQAKVAELEQRIADLGKQYAEALSDKSKLDASVAEMQAALADLEARKAAADARVAEFKDLLSKFKSLIDAGQLKVKIVDGRLVVELASDILFASGQAALSPDGEKAVTSVAQVLATVADRHFQIEGHTDNVPISTERFPSNWELGAARAITVVNALQKGGVPPARLSAASFSEYRPVGKNDNAAGKASNRRIEIVLVPDLSMLPGYEELAAAATQ